MALLAGGVVVATQGWPDTDTASPNPTVMATQSSAAAPASSAPASSTPKSTPASGKSSPSDDTAAAQVALKGCRAKVRAAERAVNAAKIGVGDWEAHVKAQEDADVGQLSHSEMDAIWTQTRLAGPADVERYTEAIVAHAKEKGSCDAVSDAPATIDSALDACADRTEALEPVLTTAAAGMSDWKDHLVAMESTAAGEVHGAQAVWIRTYRAAPRHIKAFNKAVANFDAPAC